jgi:hypothetical protein
MSKEISLRIILENPVNGTVYGLQKGKGSNYETIQPQLENGKDLFFDFVVQVKQTNGSDFSLSGPFVQGTPANRFAYIGLGSYAGQAGALLSGRLKVPLPDATLLNNQGDIGKYRWCCTVPGRTKDGKPMFATVKPFGGWFMQELSA